MRSRWNDQDADLFSGDIGLRLYSSRLLGQEPALVLHGGGNTSVKTTIPDRFGAPQDVLVVKGSGSDLATVREQDFTPVRLNEVRRLIDLPKLSNDEMTDAVGSCVLRAHAPRASIETLLHATLPFKYVDHTHADSVLAVTNTRNGEAIAARVFGELAPLVPFRHSGFELAKACDAVFRTQATGRSIGLILLHHGVVAFGGSARESYENMLRLVTRAERYLAESGAWELPRDEAPFVPWPLEVVAQLRRDVSRAAGFPLILMQQEDSVWRAFARRTDLETVCREGPATPQHAVFAKRMPMVGRDVARYARAYDDYVTSAHPGATPADLGLDTAPRVVIDPELGVWTAGVSPHYARVTAQIFRHDVEIMSRAQGHDCYAGLPSPAILEAEIHYGGFERRLHQQGGEAVALLGEVCLVAGSACALRQAVVQALLARGAAVGVDGDAMGDVLVLRPDRGLVSGGTVHSLRALVSRFGGLDALLLLDHGGEWLEPASGLLALAPQGGRVVVAGGEAVALLGQARETSIRHRLWLAQAQLPGLEGDVDTQARLIAELCQPAVAALQPSVRLN